MASIFKLGKDKRKKGAPYHIEYVDHDGKTRRRKGFSDKGLTMQLAARIENEVMLRKQGLIDPEQERIAARRRTPLSTHLNDFERSLRRKGNTDDHVTRTINRIKRIIADAGMETVADIDVESVEEVLGEMLEYDEIGHRTYNHYVQAIDSFCRWMVPDRMLSNPLARIAKLNTEVDVRHQRRALSEHEVARLLQSARESGIRIQTYDGELRARVYLVSYMTGLRRRELASLTPTSFDLSSNQPTVVVEAACSKHRKKDTLPLHPELVKMLAEWLPAIRPNESLFPKLDRRKAWLMVKKDLERVGIPYKNEHGVADFHAAGRHSYVTGLLRNGASLPEAKELARHSDVKMTMRYTHIGIADQAKALASLPAPKFLPADDGTDDLPDGAVSASVSELVSESGFGACLGLSADDAESHDQKCTNPGEAEVCDTDLLCLSPAGGDCHEWRIGDSNP